MLKAQGPGYKLIATVMLAVLCLMTAQVNAKADKVKKHSSIDRLYLDNAYPKYPKTKPAKGLRAELIKRGEYIAQLGDCIACHTNVKGTNKPFAGGLPIDTPFGRLYTPNITPDDETGIGKWTEAEFIHAMRHGQRPNGQRLFPAFPYVYFSKASDNDLRALHAYLRSIPPVNQKNLEEGFPFNMPGARLSLIGWNTLFFKDRKPYQYDASKSKSWNRGAYIVNSFGHCSMCHTPMNVFGGSKTQYFLTGAFIDGYWAPNISSSGLRSASHYQVADVFKKDLLINEAGVVAGPMAEVNHNSLNYLTKDDRIAIADYLKTVISHDPMKAPVARKGESRLKLGKQVYINSCVVCHHEGKMGAPLIGNGQGWLDRLKEHGLRGLYRHAINGYNQMPYRGACTTCTDNDVMAAVDYMLNESLDRSQWYDLKHGKTRKIVASGEEVYEENCAVCHKDGHQGAPKVGDKAAWKPILKRNLDVIIKNTVNGPNHPKRGGCKHCTTGEVISAIKYMVGKSTDSGNYTLW